ncbi:MAG: tetratricopeptide repeat protein, partial [Pirellula staleyi]
KEQSTASLEAQLLFHNRDFGQLIKLLNSNRGQSEPERELWAAQIAESGGTQLMRIGKTKDAKQFLDIARESYAEVAKVDPKRTLALAAYLARIGEIKESIEMLRGSELPPDEVGELIQSVLQTGSLKEADARELIGVAQTVQAKHPKNVLVNLGLGDLWSWLRVESEAASAYQMALEVEPNNVSVLNNLAMLLALTGPKLTEANEFIDQAVKVAGPMDYLLDTRGIVRFASGNIEGAEKDILKAIEVSPRPDRFFHLAQVLASQGRTEDARAAMKKAKDGGVSAEVLHPLERKAFESLSQ